MMFGEGIMGRPLRIDYPGAWHHVMNRGARRQPVFLDSHDRNSFLTLLSRLEERYGLSINAYCLMGNHYHLLIQSHFGEISRGLRYLDGVHAQRFNRRHGFDGPLFRSRFLGQLVEEGRYLRHVVGYIHQNPTAAGLADDPINYKWSSYSSFMGESLRPTWLRSEALYLSGIRSSTELRSATREALPKRFLRYVGEAPAYGSDDFVRKHVEVAFEPTPERGTRGVNARPALDRIVEVVSQVFSASSASILQPAQGVRSDARVAAIGLAQEVGGLTLDHIAAVFSLAHSRSAGSRLSRYRAMEARDGGFASRLKKARHLLI